MRASDLRIACVDNVSAVAYRLAESAGTVQFLSPAAVHREVLARRVDAALLPTACLDWLPLPPGDRRSEVHSGTPLLKAGDFSLSLEMTTRETRGEGDRLPLPPGEGWGEGRFHLASHSTPVAFPPVQRYVPFGRHGIACDGAVYSVCVFSDRPLESVARRGRPVWVTGKSRTSRQLLSLLCLEAYGRTPVFTETGDAASTCLLIGNEAVLGRAGLTRPTYVIDLGAWWRRHTGLPFVYARWVVRQDLDVERCQALTRWLEACTTAANGADGTARMERHAARLVGPGKLPADYYHRVHIHLNDADLAGLRLFQQRLGALAACPLSA